MYWIVLSQSISFIQCKFKSLRIYWLLFSISCLCFPVTLHLSVLDKTIIFHVRLHSATSLSPLLHMYLPTLKILCDFFFQIKIFPWSWENHPLTSITSYILYFIDLPAWTRKVLQKCWTLALLLKHFSRPFLP